MSSRSILIALLGTLTVAAGALVLETLRGASGRSSTAAEVVPRGRGGAPDDFGKTVVLVDPPRLPAVEVGAASTTVLWPLRVELELVQASYLPDEKGVQPIGSGSSARLSGLIVDGGGAGVPAEVTFVAGANAPRVLHADTTGRFGATDLLPGLSIVDVRGPGIAGSRRQVRLRQHRETLLNIGYGRPGTVFGRVVDRKSEPIAGAEILFDGTRVRTDSNGDFSLSSVAAGQVVVEVEKEGYARFKTLADVTGGAVTKREGMTIVLEHEASLVISVPENVGGPGPVQVLLLPGNFSRRSASTQSLQYPWYRIQPIEVFPGTPVRVDGLPSEVVRVHAFRPGARAKQRVANLRAGGTFPLEIHLEPAPRITGVVTMGGKTVPGARVRLEAPNRVRAMLSYFREPTYFLETGVLPLIPPAVQEVETDQGGRFTLTSWSDVAPVRYLEVRGPARSWAGRLVHSGEEHVEVELSDADFGQGELLVDLGTRHQGLPVEVFVDGVPLAPSVVPVGRELEVQSLLSGLWLVRMTWRGEPVFEDPRVRIEARASLAITLPEGAVEGQDEEAWRRAGRDFPL